jgi:hypothetical protein
MKLNSLTLVCLTAASIIGCETSFACNLQDLDISRAMAEKVSIFTATGKFERSANASEVLPGRVVACNSALGLLQIARADGSRLWIDPIDVKLPARWQTRSNTGLAKE